MNAWRAVEGNTAPCSPLTAPRGVVIEARDLPLVSRYHWEWSDRGYVYSRERPRVALHRLVMMCPDHLEVDHINGEGADNRRANLRTCTHADNCLNRRGDDRNAWGYKGVVKEPAGFYAWIQRKDVRQRFGPYATPADAHARYCEAAKTLHGEFARFF